MESIRVAVPAQLDTYVVLRQAHNGEIIRRATISFEGSFTPSGQPYFFQIQGYRPNPVGAAQFVGTSALASLYAPAGQTVNGYLMYDLAMPATEGNFPFLQENDLIVLYVQQNGTAIGFQGLTVSLG